MKRHLAKAVTSIAVLTLAIGVAPASALATNEADQRHSLGEIAEASIQASSTGYVVKATDSTRKAWVRTFGATGTALSSDTPSFDLAWVSLDDDTSPSIIVSGAQRDIRETPFAPGWERVEHWKEGSGLTPALLERVDGYVTGEGGNDSSYFAVNKVFTSNVLYADAGTLVKMVMDWATSPVSREDSIVPGTETYTFEGSAGIGDAFAATIEVSDGLVRKVSLVNKPAGSSAYLAQTIEALAYGSDVAAPDVESLSVIEGKWVTRLVKWVIAKNTSLVTAVSVARNANAIAAVDSNKSLMPALRLAAKEQFGPGSGSSEFVVAWTARGLTVSVKGSARLNDFGPSCARVDLVRGKFAARSCPQVKPL